MYSEKWRTEARTLWEASWQVAEAAMGAVHWLPDWEPSCTEVIWVLLALSTRPGSDELSKWLFPWQRLILRGQRQEATTTTPERDLKFAPDGAEMRALQGGERSQVGGGGGGTIHQSDSVPLPALLREIPSPYSFTHLTLLLAFLSWLWEMAYVYSSDLIFLPCGKHQKGCTAVSQ